jgi:L-threonylcarbamoyladenylate synthase
VDVCDLDSVHVCHLLLLQDMSGRVAAVVDGGPCACGVESTVLDGLRCPPVVLRPGGVTPELLGMCPDMQGLQVRQQSP